MFGTVRKHSNWLWMVIIVAIVISFVIFFTPNAGSILGGGGGSVTIYGETYDQEDYDAARSEVRLFFMLQGQQPPSGEVLTNEALRRLLLKTLIKQSGIDVGNDAVVDWIRERLMAGTGSIGGMSYQQYVESFLIPSGYSQAQFEAFVRTEVGSEILRETVSTTGLLVVPTEVETVFIEENRKTPLELVYLASSNFVTQVELDPEAVSNFYSNRVAAYRTPDRIQVSYVQVATSNFLAEAEAAFNEAAPLEQQVDIAYEQNQSMYSDMDPAAAKEEIRQEMLNARAEDLTQRKAYEFVNEYYEAEPKSTATMAAAAAEFGWPVQSAPPFSRNELPEGLNVGFDFVTAAWELTAEEPFAIPVLGEDGYYAISFDGRIPGQVQPLEEVRERVEEEYRQNRVQTLAREAAVAFRQAATNAVAGGGSFVELAEQFGYASVTLPGLSNSNSMEVEINEVPISAMQVLRWIDGLEDNSISNPQPVGSGFAILRVGERQDPSPEEVAAGVEEYTALIQAARSRSIFGEWLARQFQVSGLQTQMSAP